MIGDEFPPIITALIPPSANDTCDPDPIQR
jgi:hypothetical protein